LRAVAILLVVLFHTGFGWVPGGFIGVDVFFVISGYLISGQLLAEHAASGGVSLSGFWGRRARRLLPLSSLVIVVTVVLGMLVASPLGRQQIATDATVAGLYVSNWHFAQQAVAYSDALVADGLFTQFWSLSIEEQFYVILPLLFVGVMAWSRRNRELFVKRLFLSVLVLVAVSFTLSVWLTPTKGEAAYFMTWTRLWELGVGVLLAICLRWWPIPLSRFADGLAFVGLVTIVGSAFLFDGSTGYPGWKALVPVLGAVLVVAFAGRSRSWSGRVLSVTPLVVIGTWSYGWYLWHWPMLALARMTGRRWFPGFDADVLVLFAIVLSLLLAAVTYQLVENPVRYSVFFAGLPKRSLALGLGLTCIAALVGPSLLGVVDGGNNSFTVTGTDGTTIRAMTPLEAKENKGFAAGDRCFIPEAGTQVPDGCVFGDPNGSITVALIGDSHAGQWLPALDIAGKQRGWNILSFTKARCPTVSIDIFWAGTFYTQCDEWRANVLKVLQGVGRLDAVVFSNRSDYLWLVAGDSGKKLDPDRARSAWAEGSVTAFTDLLAISKRVVRLHDIPSPSEDVPDCISKNSGNPMLCSVSLETRGGFDREMIEIEKSVAPPRVSFFDPTPLVCPTDPCPVVSENGVIKFMDNNHLTNAFSASLADEFGALIESVLLKR
jgi:peptidoglycan/LPS O-acetylase OafA/YrhL